MPVINQQACITAPNNDQCGHLRSNVLCLSVFPSEMYGFWHKSRGVKTVVFNQTGNHFAKTGYLPVTG